MYYVEMSQSISQKKEQPKEKKLLSNRGIEPVTFALLARRSNQLS